MLVDYCCLHRFDTLVGHPRENVLVSDMSNAARDFLSKLRHDLNEKFEEPSDLELIAMMVVRI